MLLLLGASVLLCSSLLPTNTTEAPARRPSPAKSWADSVYRSMSEAERLGQLMMLRAYSKRGPEHDGRLKKLIQDYHIGGLCFFQGDPVTQAELVNEYQAIASPVPLMIAIDAEWGLGMRFKKSTISFPRQMTLGAITDNKLLYDMGEEVARQLKAVGVHVNFAPVADVNNNAENPVINYRSFGEDRYNVAIKSYMYAKGMEDHRVMACAKHFPGHGDTNVDSHYDLPVITHDYNRLDSIELFPFRILAEEGIGSMMVAHLHVPALDERKNRPTTLSYSTVTRLLKEGMAYDGLIFTDGLGMQGVRKHFEPGVMEAEAILAGNDVLLLPEDVPAALSAIRSYLNEGTLTWDRIEHSVVKILMAKYRLGIKTRPAALPTDSLMARLNSPEAVSINRQLIANALTLVRNEGNLVPVQLNKKTQLASLSIGAASTTAFQRRLQSYHEVPAFQTGKSINTGKINSLVQKLKKYDTVIVGLHDMSQSAKKNFGISSGTPALLRALSEHTQVVVVAFGSPYSLQYLDDAGCVLVAYDDERDYQELAAQALFGAISVKGRLPVTASAKSTFGQGVMTQRLQRFGYAPPQSMGLDTSILYDIRELAKNAILTRATPGCVVLVAKDGQIVFEEAFGHHTYERKQPTRTNDIYDLASLTKIASATLAVMKLYESGHLDLDAPIATYLPELAGTNKANLVLRDIMAHRAGLRDWIPFYSQTMETYRRRARQKKEFYRNSPSATFSIAVASDLFMRQDFADSIYQQIYTSNLRSSRSYKYSDLGFYLIARIVERVSGQPLDEYMAEHFYEPMGLMTATYNPRRQFPTYRIPPSERDNYFRLQTVQGYVHDMGAAMLGGVSGHAGLFASAKDVATILQMLLNDGHYNGQQLLQASTIRLFTQRHPEDSRRAIGFDMRQLDANKWLNLPAATSERTFGHTGFTGTCAWADPDQNLVYVFLSNRTYPSMDNKRLIRLKTRRRIFRTIYDAH